MKSFYVPIVLYGLEVTDPKKSVLTMLDNLFNRAIFKIFKVSEKDVIHDIRNFIGRHVEQLCVKRREKFLSIKLVC